uniref:DNA topoisomerase (ATP-hydrolyzing) n=1 Tax=viral metagenome TaxID=1070528 RepID=A0A6C0BZA6_9ZZZZ
MTCNVEDFEWLSGREAILLRPDAYVGSLEATDEEVVVCKEDGVISRVGYLVSPIFLKIFDEVMVNALDCATRDALVSKISCNFSVHTGTICLENDGAGIPIEYFKNTARFIPSVIFSEIHAGSNFKDEELRLTGGRNGVGVSCTNVWSSLFEVSVSDGKKDFFQKFSCNLQVVEDAEVATCKRKHGYVKVSYTPDYARLKIDLSANSSILQDMLRARCTEAGACARKGVRLTFQGVLCSGDGGLLLQRFVGADGTICEQFGSEGQPGCSVWLALKHNSRQDYWGFVNGIRCDGGTLNTHVREKLLKVLAEHIKKKHHVVVKPQTLKDVIAVLCIARIGNPCFTSQAKTVLSTTSKQIAFAVDFPARILSKLHKLGVVDEIVRRETQRELSSSLKKTLVPKSREVLIDKYDAALRSRHDPASCTLILTEGDSAKAFVVAGLSAIGRDYFGVFPLKGVPLNVTNVPTKKLLENAEIANIFRILNAQPWSDGATLRYGRVAICSDQDSDGSHICGLLINLLMTCLPSVLATRPKFIERIITPLIRATPKRGGTALSFYSIPHFEDWKKSNECEAWSLKYYKGLGTSSSREARDVFANMQSHKIAFTVDEQARDTLDKFYDDSRINDRKRLLTTEYSAYSILNYSDASCTVTDFMMREHVHFSHYSIYRALPCVLDGLTPSRRKALYYFLHLPRASEIKVAQAAAGIAQKTLYLHGENSLVETVVLLAQDHIGTNNIALLQPCGQFGSRNDKPSVHAAARYIYTKLDPITTALFHPDDAPILTHREEEGQMIEPMQFVPVLPMLLINGAMGIGTGFSTNIPSYDVKDICANVRAYVSGQELQPLRPFFRGFQGQVSCTDKSVITTGVVVKKDNCMWTITELPVGKWTDTFLAELKAIVEGSRSCKNMEVLSVSNRSTEFTVNIDIVLAESCCDFTPEQVIQCLRLSSTISTTNMYAFDPQYKLKLYTSPHDIFREHAQERMLFYEKRKEHQLKDLQGKLCVSKSKILFVDLIVNGSLSLNGVTRSELEEALERHSLPRIATTSSTPGYDYLLNISVVSFTREKVSKLKEDCSTLTTLYEATERADAASMWLSDLHAVEDAYNNYELRLLQRQGGEVISTSSTSSSKLRTRKGCKAVQVPKKHKPA